MASVKDAVQILGKVAGESEEVRAGLSQRELAYEGHWLTVLQRVAAGIAFHAGGRFGMSISALFAEQLH